MVLNESKNYTPSKKIAIPPIPLQIEPPPPTKIADMVDDLVRIPEIMAFFRAGISEYARNKYKFRIASEEQGKKREKNLQAILDNERLRDRKAGPPEKGWYWGTGCLEKINQHGKFHNIAVSGWTPPSTIDLCADPDAPGDINYGCWLLAVCHDYYLVGKRPLIIDEAFAAQNQEIAVWKIPPTPDPYPYEAMIRQYEDNLYPSLKDVHYELEKWAEKAEAEKPESQTGAGDDDDEPKESYSMRKKGKFWRITYKGKITEPLKDLIGMRYIRELLQSPNQNIPARALELKIKPEIQQKGKSGLGECASYDPKKIRAAIDELNARLQEEPNPENREQLEEEITEISQIYASSKNKQGKNRLVSDPNDQARKSIYKAVEKAKEQIRLENTDLWQHLDNAISCGTECSYRPTTPIDWEF